MIAAGIVSGSRLVSQSQWLQKIVSLRSHSNKLSSFTSKPAAKKAIYESFAAAVKSRADSLGKRKFGVLFSGGVDSSFIAFLLKKSGFSFTCFNVGMKGSKDLAAAAKAAKQLKLKLVSKEFSVAEAEATIREAVGILKTDNPVTIGIAATELAAFKLAASKGIRTVFTGLGSEEIFAGYQRHALAKDINAECWSGLNKMRGRDFVRDFKVASKFGAAAMVPFLDSNVIIAAMRAKPQWKISSNGEKKLILREVAAAAGLPKSIAFRPKLAAQYGSGFDKALGKLSRSRGFGLKRDYLASLA